MVKQVANEKNCLHKTLDDSGIRQGGLISDINGKSGQRMVNALIDGKPLQEIIKMADGRLRADKKQMMATLIDEEWTRSLRLPTVSF